MKKLTSLQLLFPFFIFMLIAFLPDSNSQGPLDPVNGEKVINVMKICAGGYSGPSSPLCDQGSYFAELNSSCLGIIKPSIYMTNVHQDPTLGESYDLPSYLPLLYIRHEKYAENTVITGPYTQATYIGKELSASGSFVKVFQIELTLAIVGDFGDCREAGSDGVFHFNRQIEIVLPSPGLEGSNSFDLFPIHGYSDPGQVFSCNDFFDTFCDCHDSYPNGGECEGEPIQPSYYLPICVLCGSCGEDIRPEPEPQPAADRKANTDAISALQVNPNPFDQTINFSVWLSEASELNYTLYDSRGQLMMQKQLFAPAGPFSSSINTDILSTGIYYLHIRQGETQTVQKLLKL